MNPAEWAGDDYAGAAGHHRRFDDWFLERHAPAASDHVVDVGCGTGEFTARLAELVPDGHVIGVEPDPSMLATAARHEAPNLEFRTGRMQTLDRVCAPGRADLVVSRAVFHWIPLADYPDCYAAIGRVLRPGGWLHAESGGAGNVARLRSVLDDVAERSGLPPATVSFPDPGVVLEMLEVAGFEIPPAGVTTVAQRRRFDREALLGLIRTQATVAYGLRPSSRETVEFVRAASGHLEALRRTDGSFDQTFVRLHVLCRRPW